MRAIRASTYLVQAFVQSFCLLLPKNPQHTTAVNGKHHIIIIVTIIAIIIATIVKQSDDNEYKLLNYPIDSSCFVAAAIVVDVVVALVKTFTAIV